MRLIRVCGLLDGSNYQIESSPIDFKWSCDVHEVKCTYKYLQVWGLRK